MDRRITNIINEIDYWVNQPLTGTFIDDGLEISWYFDKISDKLEEGEIGKWGNTNISIELFQYIHRLIGSIIEVGEEIIDAKLKLSSDLSQFNEDYIWELNNNLDCGELEFPELVYELKSITEGIKNSNSL